MRIAEDARPKVYLACKFENKDAVKAASAKLSAAGIDTVSTWHHSKRRTDAEASQREKREAAQQAVREINDCDAFVVLDAKSETGGLHFETALACGHCRLVILIGPPTNIFHELPEVHQVPDLQAATYLIKGWFSRQRLDD